jgi:hypothetical protein
MINRVICALLSLQLAVDDVAGSLCRFLVEWIVAVSNHVISPLLALRKLTPCWLVPICSTSPRNLPQDRSDAAQFDYPLVAAPKGVRAAATVAGQPPSIVWNVPVHHGLFSAEPMEGCSAI